MSAEQTEIATQTTRSVGATAPSVYAEMTLLGVMFGVSTVVAKFAAEGFPALTVSALRVLIASVVFVPVIAVLEPRWPRLTRHDVAWFLVLGATGFLGFSALYYLGLQHTTASHAVVVYGAGPMLTALISAWFLHEALTREKVAGIVITLVGVVLIVASTGANLAQGSAVGDLEVLGAILSWSCYGILARPLIAQFGPLVVTAYSVMAGALLLTPLALLGGMRLSTLTAADTAAWSSVLYSAIFSTVIAYVLWNRGVQAIGPTLTVLFTNLAPVSGFVAAFVLRGEAITRWHILSALLVVGGILLANQTGLRQSLRRAQPLPP